MDIWIIFFQFHEFGKYEGRVLKIRDMRSPGMILIVHYRKTCGIGSTWRKSFRGS
jgi:hypothetical protein